MSADETKRLRGLLEQLSVTDRPAFEAIVRLMSSAVPDRYKKVYKQ